jgi:hypothetical protein
MSAIDRHRHTFGIANRLARFELVHRNDSHREIPLSGDEAAQAPDSDWARGKPGDLLPAAAEASAALRQACPRGGLLLHSRSARMRKFAAPLSNYYRAY